MTRSLLQEVRTESKVWASRRLCFRVSRAQHILSVSEGWSASKWNVREEETVVLRLEWGYKQARRKTEYSDGKNHMIKGQNSHVELVEKEKEASRGRTHTDTHTGGGTHQWGGEPECLCRALNNLYLKACRRHKYHAIWIHNYTLVYASVLAHPWQFMLECVPQ